MIVTPGNLTGPRVVTIHDLIITLWPTLHHYMPFEAFVLELHDLWILGAPDPSTGPDTPPDAEKRVLIHTQFNKWWNEITTRYSIPTTASEAMHGITRR